MIDNGPKKPVSSPAPSLPGNSGTPTQGNAGEVGVSGTLNYAGNIRSESNSKLFWSQAYGQPGQFTWGQYETLHRTDPIIHTALQLIAAPLRDAETSVEPVDDSDEEKNIAEFVQDNLLKWLEPTWPLFIEQIVQYAPMYGFSIHEKVWGSRPDKRVPGGQAVFLKRLAQRLPSSIWVNGFIEVDGELSYIRQAGPVADGMNTKWANVELPADKILLATWQRSGRNYAGFSQFRAIWYLARMRAELLRILAIGSSREALGIPVAVQDPERILPEGELTALQKTLENLVFHENAAIVLPPGVTINWIFSAGANKGHVLELWKSLGLAILETVQAQQVYLGTNGTGSRSVGQIHQLQQTVFIHGLKAWLEAVLNGIGEQTYTGLVKQLVDLNFGQRTEYPRIELSLRPADLDLAEFALALQQLKGAGAITLYEEDEAMIREKFGMNMNPDKSKPMAVATPPVPPGFPPPGPGKPPAPTPAPFDQKLFESLISNIEG